MYLVTITILKRLLLGFLTLIFVSIVIFTSVSMLPGDFTQNVLGKSATQESVNSFRAELGLDHSIIYRYFDWLGAAIQGDFGISFSGRNSSGIDRSRSVVSLVLPRLKNTLFLASVSSILAVPLALILGITAALYRNSWFDRIINTISLSMISMPEFLLAYIMILLFASLWPIFPTISNIDIESSLWEHAYAIALPSLSLILIILAHMMRMTRASIINLLSSPYIEMAYLKGLLPRYIILYHVLPNAWGPIVTVIVFNLAYLIVGVVVVEVVFVYPGIGQLMVDAVTTRDTPVIQACALTFATIYIILNLLADIVGIVTNPRLLYPR